MSSFKNVVKLLSLSAVLTGCISKQPAYTRQIHEEKLSDGSCTTNEVVTCVGCKDEFTELGTLWNTASYGALGVPYGLVRGAYEGYQNSNQTSVILKSLEASYEGIKGIGIGCYDGLSYGYNLKYDEGRSVEGHIFDTIDHTTDYLYQCMQKVR